MSDPYSETAKNVYESVRCRCAPAARIELMNATVETRALVRRKRLLREAEALELAEIICRRSGRDTRHCLRRRAAEPVDFRAS